MSPSTSIQIQAITHLSCFHLLHLNHLPPPPGSICKKYLPASELTASDFHRVSSGEKLELASVTPAGSWISLRVVAPSPPPVDWSPCSYLAPCTVLHWQEVAHSRAPPPPILPPEPRPRFSHKHSFSHLLQSFLHVQIFHILVFPSSYLSSSFTFCLALLWAQSTTDFSSARVFTRSFQHHLRCPRHAHEHVQCSHVEEVQTITKPRHYIHCPS